jgi:hypothetical protein
MMDVFVVCNAALANGDLIGGSMISAVIVGIVLSLGISVLASSVTASGPDIDKLVGLPADIASSAYQYRADRKPDQNPPESWIGLMQYAGLPFEKAVDVNTPALKKVLCGLIWEEVRRVRRVEIAWNGAPERRPEPEEVVVTYFNGEADGGIPTWWNKAAIGKADKPEVSADGRTLTTRPNVSTGMAKAYVRPSADTSGLSALPMAALFHHVGMPPSASPLK